MLTGLRLWAKENEGCAAQLDLRAPTNSWRVENPREVRKAITAIPKISYLLTYRSTISHCPSIFIVINDVRKCCTQPLIKLKEPIPSLTMTYEPLDKPFACFSCRSVFSRPPVNSVTETRTCPTCGAQSVMMSQRFKAPKKSDLQQWKKVQLLAESGFFFQKVYNQEEDNLWRRVGYPKTLREAQIFVDQFQDQAYRFDS